jgi:alpha-L-fucosidase
MGQAFGYNQNEGPEQYGSPEKFIHMLIDNTSKNGNLLLNVGPRADGSIPEPQVAILRAIGAWLRVNGEAVYETRPWTRFAGTTDAGLAVRYTRSADGSTVYATLLGTPSGAAFALTGFPETPAEVRRLGAGGALPWSRTGDGIRIELGEPLAADLAHVFAIELATSDTR